MSAVHLIPLESTSIKAYSYHDGDDVMCVQFVGSDDVYEYADVSEDTVFEFLGSKSKGAYVNKTIAPNHVHIKLKPTSITYREVT